MSEDNSILAAKTEVAPEGASDLFDKTSALTAKLRIPLLCLLVVSVIAFTLVVDGPRYMKGIASQKWSTTTAVSRRSNLIHMTLGKEPAWRNNVIYCYYVGGVEYINDVVKFQEDLGMPGFEANQQRLRYAVGSAFKVYYDPKDPSDSCLQPGPDTWQLVIHFVSYVLFAALIFMSIYPKRLPETVLDTK